MRPVNLRFWAAPVFPLLAMLFACQNDVTAQAALSQTTANPPRAKIVAFQIMPFGHKESWDPNSGRVVYPNSSDLRYERVPADILRPESRTQSTPSTRDYPVFEPPQVGPAGQTVVVKRPMVMLALRNDGGRTIKSVEWEFTFPHREGVKEVIYRQAKSQVRIQPNETIGVMKVLSKDKCQLRSDMVNGVPQVATVCKGVSSGSHPLQVRIRRIKYTDGTVEEQGEWKVANREAGLPSFFEPAPGGIQILVAP